jgi:hypothetical protein
LRGGGLVTGQTPFDPPQPAGRWRARAQAARARCDGLFARLEEAQAEHASIDVDFRWLLRDKEIAGGVLGGGLAYRFFFWVLALSLLSAGGLGFASRSGGLEALHLFTVYYLAEKLASQSTLHGALGLAASLLFYLFLVGRGVVWSAELDAVVWDVRAGGRARDAGAPSA